MSVQQVLAWIFYAVGGMSALAFTAVYLVAVKPWRRRVGERQRVKDVRRLFLLLGLGATMLYLRSTVLLVTHQSSIPSDWPALVGTAVPAAIFGYALWLVVFDGDDRQGTP